MSLLKRVKCSRSFAKCIVYCVSGRDEDEDLRLSVTINHVMSLRTRLSENKGGMHNITYFQTEDI